MQAKYLTTPFQVKEMNTNGMIAGYASVFDEVDAQSDVVARGAFSKSLEKYRQSKSSPAMLWMHDTAEPIGVWTKLKEDMHGLYVEGQLAIKTQDGADAYELLKMGAITGLSIGYNTIKSTRDSKTKIRTLTEVELFEVSLVTFPANVLARVQTVKAGYLRTDHDELQAIVMRLKNTASILQK
ncbi:MAG: HK97 family phage prohead protease [Alphaproteobacteria bacterium]|nr:HK97 family phage prohead protease [Alphaproteobacteria bacterium]